MSILEKPNIKFPGGACSRSPECTRTFGARSDFCRTNSELLPAGMLLPMGNTRYNITYLNYTEICFFFSRNGCTFRIIYSDIYFKDC